MRILGVDYGTKRIGLALGDDETNIASPLTIVPTFGDVLRVIKEEDVEKIVLGRPMSIVHHEHPVSAGYDAFFQRLKLETGLEVIEIDERHSSKAADALSGGRDKQSRDAVAAMIILQAYLDK